MVNYHESYETAGQMYSAHGVDELKKLARHLLDFSRNSAAMQRFVQASSADGRLPTRKGDLVEWIARPARDELLLKSYYAHLSSLEQAAVQEVVHSGDGRLDTFRFEAKYGRLPQVRIGSRYSREPEKFPALAFLLASDCSMPRDILNLMKKFVPSPRGAQARPLEQLPETVTLYYGEETAPLEQHNTEQGAMQDIMAILQLVDMGKVGASPKTGRISQLGANALRSVLSHGDFYPAELDITREYDVTIGSLGIRPFAWGMLLQAGNLAQASGAKLQLTRGGQAALKKAPQETLALLWERWLKNKIFHEMSRIEVIKGQKSKSHPLYPAAPSRQNIAAALAELEEGRWVETRDFFSYLAAAGHGFDVVRYDYALYIADANYGALGYSHVTWNHVNGRFARTFLLEYAATLGLIDVALIPPWGALGDLRELWGTDDLTCLSRYDGLWALRLNSLGAWVLGNKPSYLPSFHDEASLRVLPNLEITMTGPSVASSDALFLDRTCEKVSDRVWRLTLAGLLQAVEEGIEVERVIEFLQQRSKADLPPSVRALLEDVMDRADKFKDLGEVRLIECADALLAQGIAKDGRLRKLCALTGERHLMVLQEHLAPFRKALRELGYVLK